MITVKKIKMAEGRTVQVKPALFIPIGYDEAFVKPLDEDFTCSICQLAIREPVLTRCGHRFCRHCLEQCFPWQNGQRLTYPCPTDREELVYEKDVFPDKATERKILSLEIKCSSAGCNWTGELRQKQEHLLSCPYKTFHCSNKNCKDVVLRKDLNEHVVQCKWQIVPCTYCEKPYPKCQEEEHYKECDKYEVECSYGCGARIQREKLPHHTKEECPLAEIPCPYNTLGCDVMVKKEHLESHLDAASRFHLDMACVKLNANQEEFKETTRKFESKIEALEKQLKENLDSQNTKLDKELTKLKHNSPPYIWKLEGFSEILRETRRGRDPYATSGYFFAGPNGYKLMVSMYLDGYSEGENTYVSVYINILKGKYDAVLTWPFRKTVTFTLIDQHENPMHRRNYVKRLNCDDDSVALARPDTDSNDGYGFIKFISHYDLQKRRFIVKDTLFLQVQIGPLS